MIAVGGDGTLHEVQTLCFLTFFLIIELMILLDGFLAFVFLHKEVPK